MLELDLVESCNLSLWHLVFSVLLECGPPVYAPCNFSCSYSHCPHHLEIKKIRLSMIDKDCQTVGNYLCCGRKKKVYEYCWCCCIEKMGCLFVLYDLSLLDSKVQSWRRNWDDFRHQLEKTKQIRTFTSNLPIHVTTCLPKVAWDLWSMIDTRWT